jgi:Type II secretion system (T2SS), protein E, N-terminal domain
MPFLGRKHDAESVDLMQGAMWDGDTYRPSGQVSGLNGFGMPESLNRESQRRTCGNPECSGGWMAPWRSRRRPIFEGQWGCSGRCVLAMMQAAVSRELGDGVEVATPHRHRVPLGLLMLGQGWITHPQLQRALEAQRESGTGRIGDWLQSECGVAPELVARGLSMQWGCPVLTTDGFSPEAMALVMPRMFVERLGMVPLRVAGSRILYLGFEERLDASTTFALEKMTELKVESGLVTAAQLQAARSRLLECQSVEMRLESASDKDAMASRMTAILEQKQPVAARLVRVHQYYWLRLWLENASMGRKGTLPTTGEDVNDYLFTIGSLV